MQDEGEKITMLMVPPPMKGHHFQYLMSTSFTWVYNLASPISSMKDIGLQNPGEMLFFLDCKDGQASLGITGQIQ